MSVVVFLQGLGQSTDAWRGVMQALPPSIDGVTVDVKPSVDFSLERAAAEVLAELARRGISRFHLCGLSLGAMVALQIAVQTPAGLDRLILSAGQVRPPRALMAVQGAVMRLLPARAVSAPGATKAATLATLTAVGRADFRPHLARVSAPTLVLCGGRDRPNLPASRQLAAGIPGATLEVVPGAGHEWNVRDPEGFARRVAAFVG